MPVSESQPTVQTLRHCQSTGPVSAHMACAWRMAVTRRCPWAVGQCRQLQGGSGRVGQEAGLGRSLLQPTDPFPTLSCPPQASLHQLTWRAGGLWAGKQAMVTSSTCPGQPGHHHSIKCAGSRAGPKEDPPLPAALPSTAGPIHGTSPIGTFVSTSVLVSTDHLLPSPPRRAGALGQGVGCR